ncbi:nucleotidyltransferase domain-containing protein [Halorussus halobius]|uniref:nucleotidyltransferase domain-containing protein n=1 Tax=Halorussus halobius TaxID=1710537 RepID=UPI001FCF202D|nr:nucleotidyltransferase domain-containing protein [Halorussus halobius]
MKEGTKVSVTIPASERIFKSPAEDDVLRTLVESPEAEFTVTELADTTDASLATVRRAVKHLETLDVIAVRKTPQRDYVSIRQNRLDKPDPILVIEQSEFRKPVRTFVDETLAILSETEDVDEVVGIVLFGSVARGDADRRSDVDLLIIVDGNKTVARRRVSDVAAELRDEKFDGDRYDFQPMVETVESVDRIGERLQQQFEEGIPLHVTDELRELRREVQNGE